MFANSDDRCQPWQPLHVQVSSVLRAEDRSCDMAAVSVHTRSKLDLQEMSPSSAVLQRKSETSHPPVYLHAFLKISVRYFVNKLFMIFFSLQEIDEYIVQARERSYETMVSFGKQGLSIAATAAVTAAVKASYF